MNRRGFTLLELMIVIAILGVLVAIMVPHFAGTQEAALSTRCKHNLHQLAVRCQDYATLHGFYPWGMIDPEQHTLNYWRDPAYQILYPLENPRLHEAKDWAAYRSFCWDFRQKISDGETWRPGEMFVGMAAEGMLICPKCADAKTDNWDGNHLTGYNYNVCFLGFVEGTRSTRNYPTPTSAVKYPERVVVFGDGGYAGGPNKFMRAPIQDKYYDSSSASLRKAGTQAFRHGSGRTRHCNMAFLDGHVQSFSAPYRAGGEPGWVDEPSHSAFISSGNGIYGPRGWGVDDEDEPRP